jgi:hypothetical protein
MTSKTAVIPATGVHLDTKQGSKQVRAADLALGGDHRRADAETLSKWRRTLRILHEGHWEAARRYASWNLLLGSAAAVLSAAAGTSAFMSLLESSEHVGRVVAGVLGLLAAVMASVQTSYKAGERAEQHRTAAGKYGKLRHTMDKMLLEGLPADKTARDKELDDLVASWDDVDASTLPVPQEIYKRTTLQAESSPERDRVTMQQLSTT